MDFHGRQWNVKLICFLIPKKMSLTSIANRAVSTHDAWVHKLDTAAIFWARAWLAVIRSASNGVTIETFGAKFTVAASSIMLADTETWKKYYINPLSLTRWIVYELNN